MKWELPLLHHKFILTNFFLERIVLFSLITLKCVLQIERDTHTFSISISSSSLKLNLLFESMMGMCKIHKYMLPIVFLLLPAGSDKHELLLTLNNN